MHLKRLVVAAALLPLMYAYIMYLPSGYFFALLVIISLLGASEFYSMYRVRGTLKYVALLSGAFVVSVSYFAKNHLWDAAVVSIMVVMAVRLFWKKDPVSSLSDLAAPVVGILYVPGLLSFQTFLKEAGSEWIIFLYGTVWASDSMAYYIGKGIGRRKLYKEVSPNKTVEGGVGSLIGGMLGALILKTLLVQQLSGQNAVLIGIIIGAVSIIGDLVESMFKRDAGVKDSGVIIPGHGGVLDKVDGSLFAGPVLYWVLTAMKVVG